MLFLLPKHFSLYTSKVLYKLNEFSFKSCSACLSISLCSLSPHFHMSFDILKARAAEQEFPGNSHSWNELLPADYSPGESMGYCE